MTRITICAFFAAAASMVYGQRTVELTPNTNEDEKSFYSTIVEIPVTDFFSPVSNLALTSNIPVTVLKYRSNFESSRLIHRNEVVIFIKSSCDDPDDVPSEPAVNIQEGILVNEPKLNINLNGLARESQGLLPLSTFTAKYNHTNYMCAHQCHTQVTEPPIEVTEEEPPFNITNQTYDMGTSNETQAAPISTNETLTPVGANNTLLNSNETLPSNNSTDEEFVPINVNETVTFNNTNDSSIPDAGGSLTDRPDDNDENISDSDGGIMCAADMMMCPDGVTMVSRDLDNGCEFYPCEVQELFCTEDAKACPDGKYVSRDPNNDCEFIPCEEASDGNGGSGVSPDDNMPLPESGGLIYNPEVSDGMGTSLANDIAYPNTAEPNPSTSSSDIAESTREDEYDEVVKMIQGSPLDPSFGIGASLANNFVVVISPNEEDYQVEDANDTGFLQGIIESILNRRKKCQVTAEILYDSCRHRLKVSAPMVQVYDDVDVVEVNRVPIGSECMDKCDFATTVTMSYPDVAAETIVDKAEDFIVEALDQSMCFSAADGRPFMDGEGKPISSVAEVSDTAEWGVSSNGEPTSISSEAKELNEHKSIDYDTLGADWTDRALGEHASIASFAAFTISLMTNGAPPGLIRDSLNAALDELNHATTSFDMASLLTGLKMEPGPFPESELNFKKDRKSLALGVVGEGCVDETLSALLAAQKVDLDSDDGDSIKKLLKEKTRTIAREEASHSALAWRTVHWLCATDEDDACGVAKSYLHDKTQERVANRIEGNGLIEKEWARLLHTLVPLVVGNAQIGSVHMDRGVEPRALRVKEGGEISFVEEIVNLIIDGVKKGIET